MNIRKQHPKPIRVGMISLGCAKNLVDAEVMIGSLLADGMEMINDPSTADVLIVNTCSFIESAQQESIDTILESDQLRAAKRLGQGLVVSGCLPQRFREELPKLLPEVDAFMGVDQVASAPQIVRQALEHRARRLDSAASMPKRRTGSSKASRAVKVRTPLPATVAEPATVPAGRPTEVAPLVEVSARPNYVPDYHTPRFRLTPRHFAYLKIAEGCNHPCSFCIIPRMRGSHRSRLLPDIVREAEQMLQEGVLELNLISQDSTYYGMDLRPVRTGSIASPERFQAASRQLAGEAPTLSVLLRQLNQLSGEFWIRLLYTHPAHWTDELIETLAQCPKVARYVDMPLQHIHENMLERMRRETSPEYIIDLIRRIRKAIPGIALRTTFIVGFPGETEASFETLLAFIRQTQFERLGVFTYSHEEGTRAAQMGGQVPDEVKRERRDRAMAEQVQIAERVSAACVGQELRVLVEREASAGELPSVQHSSWEHGMVRANGASDSTMKGRFLLARSEADAPDIDGRVYVRGEAPVGRFATVKVIGHTKYDLLAQVL